MTTNDASAGPLDRNVRRHRAPAVGDWYEIRKNRDNGGCPLIRVESITEDGKVIVTDWLDFDHQYIAPPTPIGYKIPAERIFSGHYASWEQRMKAWKKVAPNA
jgi:hypothetical protein